MPDWGSVFAMSVPPLELVFRGTVTYLVLMALMRVVGQRESGGLGLTDVLVVVLAADAASTGLTGGARSVAEGFVVVATILFWSVAVDAAAYRWPRLATVVKARPRVLIADGVVNRRAMRREFMSMDEVMSQLRLQGIEDPARVRRAYLEPNGHVSILLGQGEAPGGGGSASPGGGGR